MRTATTGAGIVLMIVTGCGTGVPEVPIEEPVSYATHLEPLVIAHCIGCHESRDSSPPATVAAASQRQSPRSRCTFGLRRIWRMSQRPMPEPR